MQAEDRGDEERDSHNPSHRDGKKGSFPTAVSFKKNHTFKIVR
jgi:hypothetical protein